METPPSSEDLLSQLALLKEGYIRTQNEWQVLLEWKKPELEALYLTKIGSWQVKRLQVQLRVKGLKLKLEKLRSQINRNLPVDITTIELEVATVLAEAEAAIMTETGKIAGAINLLSHLSNPQRSNELRKEYCALAKLLHPDVNDHLTKEQIELWHLVTKAYEQGDLEGLQLLKVVYDETLRKSAEQTVPPEKSELEKQIDKLKEGVRKLHLQITQMMMEFPFTLQSQLYDDAWVSKEVAIIQEELEQLDAYEQVLSHEYHQLISSI